jgi:hypothetical protein
MPEAPTREAREEEMRRTRHAMPFRTSVATQDMPVGARHTRLGATCTSGSNRWDVRGRPLFMGEESGAMVISNHVMWHVRY